MFIHVVSVVVVVVSVVTAIGTIAFIHFMGFFITEGWFVKLKVIMEGQSPPAL